MATTDPWDFSTTKASNIDIGGTNIGASMLPSNVNDAFQNLAAHIAKLLNRSSDLPSAATLNLDSVSSEFIDVTGTTTTTAITLADGQHRFIRAAAAWPITASGTLIVNGSNSVGLTCAAGDFLLAEGYATGVVRISPINRSASVAGTNLPPSDDGAALGSASERWSDLFLASGGVINWNAGDVTITHSADVLAFAGAATRYSFNGGPITPSANDGVALGTGALGFADLFLASGGVINWNNGTFTITQSGSTLAFSGTLTLGSALASASGGTGTGTYTQGDILYASATNTLSKLPKGTARQMLRMNTGATVPEWGDRFNKSGESTAASGTSVSETSIPADVQDIVISLDSVQTNGSSIPLVQLGDSGGYETTGYESVAEISVNGVASNVGAGAGDGFAFGSSWAGTAIVSGMIRLHRISTTNHKWLCDATVFREDSGVVHHFGGIKTLSAELTQVRIIMTNGTDAFDGSGTWNVTYGF